MVHGGASGWCAPSLPNSHCLLSDMLHVLSACERQTVEWGHLYGAPPPSCTPLLTWQSTIRHVICWISLCHIDCREHGAAVRGGGIGLVHPLLPESVVGASTWCAPSLSNPHYLHRESTIRNVTCFISLWERQTAENMLLLQCFCQ